MATQTLNGHWLLRQRNTQDWLHASVPGGVHTDLLAADRIPDPFLNANEENVQWVAEKDWEYRRYFYPNAQIMAQDKVYLVFSGLDTLADVRLNGKILGSTNNMYHAWEWEVKDLLHEGENILDIVFRSPIAYIRQRQRIHPMLDMSMGIRNGAHMRKTPSHFGWDWGPRLACIGIWKDVTLQGRNSAHLIDVRYEQVHEIDEAGRMVMLTARVRAELGDNHDTDQASAVYTLRLRLTGPERQVWQVDSPARVSQSIPIKITNPELWWPNGLGQQALYRVELELLEENRLLQETHVIDTHTVDLGLRTIELRQEEDGPGANHKSFQFVVNGVSVFCKGSNWIPGDSFPSRLPYQQLEHLIRSAAEAHHNMLRVWGGGYYESDAFYELCDRYGILVWQDFMFACSTYPLDDPTYVESACHEIIENVRRLRHHASLALWCGNNEIEWLSNDWGWNKKRPELKEAYERFFFHRLPELLQAEDPQGMYWPGSPTSNEAFINPNGFERGDAHLWQVYHYYKLPGFYRTQNPRFASEFGFQSLPATESIQQFTPSGAERLNSKVMECHQRALAGNPKLLWYIAQRFRLPRKIQDLAYVSQVYQAEAIRTAVEHWRRHPEVTGGALYWQLNDCWPVISWSSIDYYGRWKALHYASRRFFAPVLLSIEEDASTRKAAVWISNDLTAPWEGRLHWTLETLDGDVLEGGEQAVQVGPTAAAQVLKLDFSHPKHPVNWHKTFLTVELWQGEESRCACLVNFLPEKRMSLGDPGLQTSMQVQEGQLLIFVTARRLARFIELKMEGADLVFSDNYFDLPARRTRTITCPLPDGWTLDQAQAALRVNSLGAGGSSRSLLLSDLRGGLAIVESLTRTGAALARM